MARNSSVDLDITNNAVGPTIGGGIPTERRLSWAGNGDITLNQASASVSSTIYSFPTASGATDNIICSSLYNAAGTIAYGTGSGTYPSILPPGTTGQALFIYWNSCFMVSSSYFLYLDWYFSSYNRCFRKWLLCNN